MFKSWCDERFLAVTARDYRQGRIRVGLTLGLGVLLALAADWRPALAWMVGALALEAPFWQLTRPLAEGPRMEPLRAGPTLVLQFLLACAWSFAGAILWSGGGALGMAAAMSLFAALLFHVTTHRGRSPGLVVAASPTLAAPLLTPLLFPQAAFLDQLAVLLLTGLVVAQAGFFLGRGLIDARHEAARALRPAPRTARPATEPPRVALAGDEMTLEKLAEAKAEAEAANQAKSAFLAIMSHEIRTPLNGILGMTQALVADPSLNSQQRQRLAVIRQSGESLLSILNDILDLSKVEAGKLELEQIEFDLAELARGAQDSFTALAGQKGLKCRLAVDPAAQGVYLGDPTRVRQILFNLISNALKFTEHGEIRVGIGPADGGVRMTVVDTGVGIEPEQLERLFGRFEQADPSSTRRYGGTGLGLSICRDLCGLMGGSIEVESKVGQGTTFTVTLPLERVADAGATAAAPAGPPAMDAGGLRILAAEDNPTNQMVLKALLAPIGMEPTVVDDGAQAVEAWSTGDYDLILMDIQMPRMDGMTAARTIRAEEARTGRPRIPIVALTANAMAHQVEEYFAAGMDLHVAKPINLAALYGAIESLQAQADGPAAAPTRAAAGRP